jgi:hypothetical protein
MTVVGPIVTSVLAITALHGLIQGVAGHGYVHNVNADGQDYTGWLPFQDPVSKRQAFRVRALRVSASGTDAVCESGAAACYSQDSERRSQCVLCLTRSKVLSRLHDGSLVTDISSQDLACNTGGETGTQVLANVTAGSSVTFLWENVSLATGIPVPIGF